MLGWDAIVDFLRIIILTQAQNCGGNLGGGILLASCAIRLALFPLTLKMAKAAAVNQKAMAKLKPKLDALKKKFRDQPTELQKRTQTLFQENGVSPLKGCVGVFLQTPVLIAFYSAVRQVAANGGRFLWIRNIAKPDIFLTLGVAALTFASMLFSTSTQTSAETRRMMLLMPLIITVVVLMKTSAGVALYWGVASSVSLVQNYLARRAVATA